MPADSDRNSMKQEQDIQLRVTPESITQFCREVTRSSGNIGRKHATLVALSGFITRHAGTGAHTSTYERIQAIIRDFSGQTRTSLLEEYAEALAQALLDGYWPEVARVHAAVSRNGFMGVLGRAMNTLNAEDQERKADEIRNWCEKAEQAASGASGYPDAMNFRAAGIDLRQYTAMSDIRYLLTGTTPPA
jgi:hypothetical protein